MPHFPLSNHLLRLSTYEGFKDKEHQRIFRELMREYAGLCDTQYVPRKTWQLSTPSKTVFADLKKDLLGGRTFFGKKSEEGDISYIISGLLYIYAFFSYLLYKDK